MSPGAPERGFGPGPGRGQPAVPGSIAAVKRIRTGLVAAVALLVAGAATSACTVTPNAASVNGDTIAVSALNTQLTGWTATLAGRCLLSLDFPNALDLSGTGSGGSGTYRTGFAAFVLSSQVDNLLGAQFLAAHGVQVSAGDRAQAQQSMATLLDGAITAQTQQAAAIGGTAACTQADGSPFTGAAVLAALPADVRGTELANQAIEQHLLARVADLPPNAEADYYLTHPTEFVQDCVSAIQTTDQATADNAYNALRRGTPFAEVAAAASANPAVQSRSGQAGCTSEASVLSQLQQTSVTVNQPITPIQSSGTWTVFVVTSRTPEPFAQAQPSIHQILLQSTANRQRAQALLVGFARTSSIEVNPQYGTWVGGSITPPPSPKARYLAPSTASSATVPTTTVPLTVPAPSGSQG